ncbi:glycosyltransferase family 4 protein [Spirulina major]|uniref:glycosyltransferase family 4 protein n=1 Tax=Spirulina major TaxID=270636 RepID=UPI0009FE4B55|nr:glycosyltransferase family 4 protein [Spirulina major]
MTIASLFYLSAGTMPSPVANEIQAVKMAQAFAPMVKRFELIVSGNLRSCLGLEREFTARFNQWYGVRVPFTVTRIPSLTWRTPFPFPEGSYSPRKYLRWAIAYCQRQQPTVVYTRTPYLVTPLLAAGLPVVLEFHEPITPQILASPLLQHPNLIAIVTLADELRSHYIQQGCDPAKICIAPSAVDLAPFIPAQPQAIARQALNLATNQPIALYAGNLYDYKGIPTILQAATQLPHCQFVLVGGQTKDVERVRSQALRLGLHNLQITGYKTQAELPPYLFAADLLLLPTSQQWKLASTTSPLKLFEYMAAQRPIIASDLPNIATVLRDRHNGRLIPPDDPDAMADAIRALLADPVAGDAIAAQAWQDVQHHTWTQRAATILQFISARLSQS